MLAALEEFGPASQADLGRRLGLDGTDVSSVVGVLDRDGLVHRVTDPADSRRRRIEITPRGLVLLERLGEAIELAQDDLLAALSVRDRAELARILAALTEQG
jgi:DNA-binding MarR family transcriptional regulator